MGKQSKFLSGLITAMIITACGQPINNPPMSYTPVPPVIEQDFGPLSPADITLDTSDVPPPVSRPDNTILKVENDIVNLTIEQVYAPALYFDSQESAFLTSVPKFLEMGVKLEAEKPFWKNPRLKDKVTAEELAAYTTPKVKIKGHNLRLMLQTDDKRTAYDPVVYTHKFQIGESTYLQYWFFYSYNDASSVAKPALIHKCGKHQGDWEHVSLKINTAKYTAAKAEDDFLAAIDGVYFSQHNTGQNDFRKFKKVGDSDLHMEGTHIKSYVARGTHATYSEPSSGKGYLLGSILGIKMYDNADGKGISLNSTGHLVDMSSQSWSRYGGLWGEISNDICTPAEWVSDVSNDGPSSPYYRDNYNKSDWDT
jgi:hypothetical protein